MINCKKLRFYNRFTVDFTVVGGQICCPYFTVFFFLQCNERHFWFQKKKKKTIPFFWSKSSKLHKKDPILHVTTTFSLKQTETRTSSGPIPHPLNMKLLVSLWCMLYYKSLWCEIWVCKFCELPHVVPILKIESWSFWCCTWIIWYVYDIIR